MTDRAINRTKIDFLVRLGEPQFAQASVTYAQARATYRRIKVATSALQRIIIRHNTAAKSFFKWKYLSAQKSSVAAPVVISVSDSAST